MNHVIVADLGMGNLRSVAHALERAGARVTVSDQPSVIASAERLVVPGQGHFQDCARAMDKGFGEACRTFIATGRPYLGLCLGMQILFSSSEEAPNERGLGFFEGEVVRFKQGVQLSEGRVRKIPHMGWNQVDGDHAFLSARDWFYFVHSFHCVPKDQTIAIGTSEYGERICAAVAKENVVACQFHPEKSQHAGARLLENFVSKTWVVESKRWS